MDLGGCEEIRKVTRGCRLVLLAATDAEAQPLLRALRDAETHVVATKNVVVGSVGADRDSAAAGQAGRAVRAVLAVSGCDKANVAHLLACLLLSMDPLPSLVLQAGVGGAFAWPAGGASPEVGSARGVALPGPGGARQPEVGSAPRVGDLVFATEEIYSDTGSSSPAGWLSATELGLPIAVVAGIESGGRFPLDQDLVRAAVDLVQEIDDKEWPGPRPAVFAGPCVTASLVTGIRSEGEAIVRRWGALAESMEGAAAAHVCALHRVPFLEVRGISNLIVDRGRASWELDRAVETAGRAALAVAVALDVLPLPSPPGA